MKDCTLLLEQRLSLTRTDDRTTKIFDFTLPEGNYALLVQLDYLPKRSENSEDSLQIIESTLRDHAPWMYTSDRSRYLPLTNLITVSLDSPDGYCGNAHNPSSSQSIYIGRKFASPGFLSDALVPGKWRLCLHIHALVTDQCTVNVSVSAVEDSRTEASPARDIPTFSTDTVGSGKLRWFPAELHCHTNHSDGCMTPDELASNAARQGLGVIALTDHNTSSSYRVIEPKENIINGFELTTYYGHITALGGDRFADWRELTPSDGDKCLREIHECGGIAGIAHPFRIGGPIGTGCHFDIDIKDPGLIDYFEISHGLSPAENPANKLALEKWLSYLDAGFRIAPVYGLDWHCPDQIPTEKGKYIATTWLATDKKVCAQSALDSLRSKRTVVSLGPLPDMTLTTREGVFYPGDSVPLGRATVSIRIYDRPAIGNVTVKAKYVRLIGKGGKELAIMPIENELCEAQLDLGVGYVFAEVLGELDGKATSLAITSPIYISHRTIITAHSGCEATPPNSIGHILASIASGADALEIDVRRRPDGVLYLSHDDAFEEAYNCPTLRRCFELVYPHPPIIVNCDVKEPNIANEVLSLARECGMATRLVFTGELLTDEGIEMNRSESEWWVNLQYAGTHEEELEIALEKIKLSGSPYLNMKHKLIAPDLPALGCGVPLSGWTASNEKDISRILELGVYNITTRTPLLAVQLRDEYEASLK